MSSCSRLNLVAATLVAWMAVGCLSDEVPVNQSTIQSSRATLQVAGSSTEPGVEVVTNGIERFPDEVIMEWGAGWGQAGLIPPQPERLPMGPMAIALGPEGTVWLLDQVNDRLVELGPEGDWLSTRPCPPGAIDLAVAPDGRPAVLSLVNHRVSLINDRGAQEVVGLPLPLRVIVGIGFDEEGRLLLENGYQETYMLGQQGAWRAWPDLLHTKRDGIRGQGAGPLRQVMLGDDHALLLDPGARSRLPAATAIEDTAGVASVALVSSLSDGGAIVLVERFEGEHVARTLLYIDSMGRVLSRSSVPSSLLYFPFREFVAADDGTVLHLYPTADGLFIRPTRLGEAGGFR